MLKSGIVTLCFLEKWGEWLEHCVTDKIKYVFNNPLLYAMVPRLIKQPYQDKSGSLATWYPGGTRQEAGASQLLEHIEKMMVQ